MNSSEPPSVAARRASGTWIVGGMIGLAVVLALFAVWYQRAQTRRCLAFYGSEAARRIQDAPRVELWRIGPTEANVPPVPTSRVDITAARGLVHLRRGLVEDANFAWESTPASPSAPAYALAFFDAPNDPDPGTILVVAVDDGGGSLSVVGRGGTVSLGRIAAGLRAWLAAVTDEPAGGVSGGAAGGG